MKNSTNDGIRIMFVSAPVTRHIPAAAAVYGTKTPIHIKKVFFRENFRRFFIGR